METPFHINKSDSLQDNQDNAIQLGGFKCQVKNLGHILPDFTETEKAYSMLLSNWDSFAIAKTFEYRLLTQSENGRILMIIISGDVDLLGNEGIDLFQYLIKKNVKHLLVSKNHPDAEVLPNQLDEEIANRLDTLAKAVNITIVDQIIMSSIAYFSFAANPTIR